MRISVRLPDNLDEGDITFVDSGVEWGQWSALGALRVVLDKQTSR